jgi:hypothetical protein
MQTDLDAPEAYRAVAKVLTRRGVKAERGSGKITADTVRHWCVDELPADVGRHGPAAWMYDSMFTADEDRKFSCLSSTQARLHALASLDGWVKAMSPSTKRKTS